MKRILIIEDYKSIREELTSLLNFEGYDVIEAEDGVSGYELAKSHLPDLIISDIILPNLDGFDVLHEIRNNPTTSKIPFFFLTAMTGQGAHLRGLDADDYIEKPYYPDKLIEKIKKVV